MATAAPPIPPLADPFEDGPPPEATLLSEPPPQVNIAPRPERSERTERTERTEVPAVSSPAPSSAASSAARVRPTPAPALVTRVPLSAPIPPAAPRLSGAAGVGTRYPMPGPSEPEPTPQPPSMARPPGGVYLTPRMTAIFGGLFGLAMVTSVVALLIQVVPPRNERAIIAGIASSGAVEAANALGHARPEVKKKQRIPLPGPWRVAELEKDPSVIVESGTMDRKSLLEVLGDKGVPKAQVYRIMKAFDGVRKFDKSARKDRYIVAMERATRRVKAFEYELSAWEVYQSREGTDGLLSPGAKLDMKIAEGEVSGTFYVGSDMVASIASGGFEDSLPVAMDEALSGRISTDSFEEGGTVRVIAIEETALGLFSRYKRIIALEYRPPDPSAKPVRVYTFNGQEARGYWDDRGKQPYAGGWRSPVPGAPVTSRFNPKRMHPILHKLMPHQGTDYGAPAGTPIYSAYKGVVAFVGPHGATGNWVAINHPNGVETGYAHLSRFAAGLKVGDKVGTHQLIGYVGSTGRSTGPHLHFSARKNNVFFDAETLQLDGERVVPTVDRQGFLSAKADLDRRLDAIALPEPPPELAKAVAAAGSAAAGPGETPPDSTVATGPGKGGRHAVMIGSPAAIAAAAAEPGIHPKSFIEDNSENDDDSPAPIPVPSAGPGAGKVPVPDPAESEEDEEPPKR